MRSTRICPHICPPMFYEISKPLKVMVGAGRFELPTPCSRSKCATALRNAPTDRQSFGQRRGLRLSALGCPSIDTAPGHHHLAAPNKINRWASSGAQRVKALEDFIWPLKLPACFWPSETPRHWDR